MPCKILMPSLSPTMESGKIANWLVKENSEIKVGDVICEIETDKAIIEFESPNAGKLAKIIRQKGDEDITVGSVIAVILEKGDSSEGIDEYIAQIINNQDIKEKSKETEDKNNNNAKETEQTSIKTEEVKQEDQTKQQARLLNSSSKASPIARRIAEKRGIDIDNIYGTGPGNRVVKRDVEVFGSFGNSSNIGQVAGGDIKMGRISNELAPSEVPLSGMRKVIAKRLQESKSNIPHFYLSVECDITKMSEMRHDINDKILSSSKTENRKISLNDMIVRATGIALSKHPKANQYYYNSDKIIQNHNIDVSIAISLADGLVAPKICDVDLKSLMNVSLEIKEIIERAKLNKITPQEMSGGSITVSNMGMLGIDEFYAIINPPQSAILAVGKSSLKPVVSKDKEIIIREMMTITLSADHRVLDGADAAKFLGTLKGIIESPSIIIMQN